AVVRVVNRSPVANAVSDQSGILGSAVTFRGSGSDQDGTVTSYTWDFGDGASAAGATASHAYATAGTYTAKLTVTDDRGALGSDSGPPVAVDSSGNGLVTGKSSSTVDFGTGALTSAGRSSIFLAKSSSAGAPVWSRAFGGGLNDVGNGVAVDSGGNVVIIGTASGTVSFGGGPITANGYTVVVAKFSPAGAHLWSRGFGDSFSNSGNGVAVEPGGHIAVTGAFSGPIDVGGGAL